MIFIRNDITDPYFNIAAEEYFLRDTENEYFLQYVNEPSVIIGKHQNAYAEINYGFIKDNNIKVVRRMSGGGAVWHDPGNLNFSFIRNGIEGELVNFRKFMQPVMDFLIKLGLKAGFAGKNSIEVNGYKVSGNAEHVCKKRVLHHGTLLFNTNPDDLAEALKADPQKYLDKSVKSIRTKTANIIDMLDAGFKMKEFGDAFFKHILEGDPGGRIIDMGHSDIQKIKLLVDNKYSKWDWNFGYSPSYKLINKTNISGCDLGIFLEVGKGRIGKIIISGNLIEPAIMRKIETALNGQKHEEGTVKGILRKNELNAIFDRVSPAKLVKLFF